MPLANELLFTNVIDTAPIYNSSLIYPASDSFFSFRD